MSFRISLPAWLPWKHLLFSFVFRKSLTGRILENRKLVLVTRQQIVTLSSSCQLILKYPEFIDDFLNSHYVFTCEMSQCGNEKLNVDPCCLL